MAGFSILAKLGLDSSKFSSSLKGVRGKLSEFGSAIGTVVKAGAVAAGAAITALAVKGIKDFVNFDKGMREVFTLLPGASEAMKNQMAGDMRELAVTMGVDLQDSVQGLYQSLSAGIPKESAINFLKTATKLAIGGVTDLSTSVGGLTTVLNGYGMAADQAGKVSDILFTAVEGGMTTIEALATNVGKVTPIAAALGVSLEEVGAMFSTLTSGLGEGKTAEAGTKITAMLVELGKAGTKASVSFQQLSGESFRQFMANGGTVNQVLQIMKQSTVGTDKTLIDMFSSIEAGQGALILAADNGAKFTKELKDQAEAAGAHQLAFEEMEKSVARQMERLQAQITEVGLKIGEALLPVGLKIMPMISRAFEMFLPILGATSGAGQTAASGMNAIVSVAEALIKGVLMMVNVFGMWADILTFVGKQIAVFAQVIMDFAKSGLEPIVKVVKGVGEAFSAMGEILSNPRKAAEGVKKLKKAASDVGNAMSGIGDAFGKAWDKNLAGFKANNQQFIQDMNTRGQMFKKVWDVNLQEAGKAQVANQAAVDPLIQGNAAAQGIHRGIKGARRNAGPLNQRLREVKGHLEGAKKWAEKCAEVQQRWNKAAEDGAKFHKDTQTILEDLLKKEGLRFAERKAYIKMLETQKELEEDMRDVSREGYNWLVKQKEKFESMAEEQGVLIKNLPAMRDGYEEIVQRIADAEANMKDNVFQLKLMKLMGDEARDAWTDVSPMGGTLRDALANVKELELKLDELGPAALEGNANIAAINLVADKLIEAKKKAADLREELLDNPLAGGKELGKIEPKVGNFQIFKDMDKKLGNIDEKLGGFFINQ